VVTVRREGGPERLELGRWIRQDAKEAVAIQGRQRNDGLAPRQRRLELRGRRVEPAETKQPGQRQDELVSDLCSAKAHGAGA
jgi:hypothetical protein